MNNKLLVYCDGGSRGNPGPAASVFIVLDEDKNEIKKQGEYIGIQTNNTAEYKAVLLALGWLIENGYQNSQPVFYLDSQLVVNQLGGIYRIKEKKLLDLSQKIKHQEKLFPKKVLYNHIFRERNRSADALVNLTLDLHK